MSVTQALAAMLGEGARANAQITAAGLAANAHGPAANAGLRGDIYRTNMQGRIGEMGIAAQNQRDAAELMLRQALGMGELGIRDRQVGMEGRRLDLLDRETAGRLDLMKQQLGLDRERMTTDRDIRLGEIGVGPYAADMPDFSDIFGGGPQVAPKPGPDGLIPAPLLGGGASTGSGAAGSPLMEMAKRMFASRDPRVRAQGLSLLQQAQQQANIDREHQFKVGALRDPMTYLGPLIQGGVDPSQLGPVLSQLREILGGGGDGGALMKPGPASFPSLNDAASALAQPGNQSLLQALGISGAPNAYDAGRAINSRLDSLTPADLSSLQRIFAASAQSNPRFFDKIPGAAETTMIREMLGLGGDRLTPDVLRKLYQARQAELRAVDPWEGTPFGSY